MRIRGERLGRLGGGTSPPRRPLVHTPFPSRHQRVDNATRSRHNQHSYLHRRSFVHGDLRSPNLFVAADGRVKIGDFGFCRLLAPEALQVREGAPGRADASGPRRPASSSPQHRRRTHTP